MLSPREVTKKVAQLIEEEHICYIHRTTREISSFLLSDKDTSEVAEQIAIIETNIDKYMKVMPMNTSALITAMEYFIPEVTDKDIAKELARGMKRKNPTRNFMQIVDAHMDIQMHWDRFKREHIHWYTEQVLISEYNH